MNPVNMHIRRKRPDMVFIRIPLINWLGAMKAVFLICLFVSLGVEADPQSNSRYSASTVAADIRSVGASAVLRRYYETPAWSKSIIPGIRSAAPAWLAVAAQLHQVSDAGASEDLDGALYAALTVAPFRVLPIMLRLYGGTIEDLCNVSFEADVPKPGVSASAYLDEIRTKLGKAHTSAEKVMATSCYRGLNRAAADAED